VAPMEDSLELYHTPDDPQVPMVCMDAQPVQLIKATRTPLPAAPGHPERDDDAYERHGTATIFMFTAPVSGVRPVSVREPKPAIDGATEVKHLLDTQSPAANRIRLVCDHLHRPGLGSRYEALPPEQARVLAARLASHPTPKQGSWRNLAASELRALTRQCLDRRMPDRATLREETNHWEQRRPASPQGVDWQVSTQDARITLKPLSPHIRS
jgi:DDE superfamily endonuclease